MKSGKNKTLAIDFDGVIHKYSNSWQDGTIYDDPVPGVQEALTELKEAGYELLIFSTRGNPDYRAEDGPDQKAMIEAYMEKHGIPYDQIWTGGKPKSHVYVDDRAVTFKGDWKQALKDIDNFKVWNRPNAKSASEIENESKNNRLA